MLVYFDVLPKFTKTNKEVIVAYLKICLALYRHLIFLFLIVAILKFLCKNIPGGRKRKLSNHISLIQKFRDINKINNKCIMKYKPWRSFIEERSLSIAHTRVENIFWDGVSIPYPVKNSQQNFTPYQKVRKNLLTYQPGSSHRVFTKKYISS